MLIDIGEYKWQKLGMDYELGDVQPPSLELIERVGPFRERGLFIC